ncbi:hypothetical protein [Stenotrophomonas lacuserhaii]|uniref:hypothetical protein n=1 Tax=Stenotrophomonas lacuserhaii TaxID=2760084 RepID=UPI0015FAA17E|nr:hypothetical protein [Stenotrophomonas lacuserhaii]
MKRAARGSTLWHLAAGALLAVCVAISVPVALAWTTPLKLPARHSRVVEDLERWYGNVVDDCGGGEMPAYQCSGILLRATRSAVDLLPWEPTDRQIAKGSVAFSWLRQDDGFGRPFGRQNGFILYPSQEAPGNRTADMQILCSFPINASTDRRPTLQGCGPIESETLTTDTCQRLGISTARQWLGAYPEAGNYRVCGWDLRHPGAEAPARWFKLAAEAHQALPDKLWAINNEVLVATWPEGSGGQLPLHSFFHVQGGREALIKAQYDQIRYYQHHGLLIPIVRLGFPASKQERMSFSYDLRDQAVGQPARQGSVDFEDADVGRQTRVTAGGFEFELKGDRVGVSDRGHPASHGLISGRHLSVDSAISFALEGAGRRRVAFSWGCNRPCGLQKVIADEHILLFDQESGDMRYGSTEFTLDGPEAFVLLTDSEDDEMEMVLDNLEVRELPAGARRSDGRRSALVADVDRDPALL